MFDARRFPALLVACTSFCVVTTAHAQVTWSGTGSNGLWSTSGNWSSALSNNFNAALVFDGVNNLTNTNDRTSGTATSITFNAGAGAFTIEGEAITLGGGITNATSHQTINNDLSVAATRTLSLNVNNGELVLGGNISGAGGLTASTTLGSGAGTSYFTLSGSNSFGGTVTLNARTGLNINHAHALGTVASLSVRNGATIDNKSGADVQLSGTHNITIAGNDGGFTFNATNSLDFGHSTLTHTNTSGMSLTVNGAGTITLGGIVPSSLSANFTKSGAGGLALRSAAPVGMSGNVTISGGGTVQLGDNRSLGDGSISFSAGVLQAMNSARTLSNTVTLGSGTVSGAYDFAFSGPITGQGGNPRTLANNLAVNATLTIGNLGLNADTANLRTLTISGSGNTLITGTISNGNASRNQNLTIDNTGVTTISGTSTYGGTTQVNAGTLVFRSTAAKGAGTVTAAAAGAIGLGVGGAGYYSSADVASLFGNTLAGFSLNAASGVAIDTTAGDFTVSDALSGSRVFTKLGAGTLTLRGANTYTGSTIISAGTLALGTGGSLAGSKTIVAGDVNSSGAVLDLSALAGVGNTFTFASDQKVMGKGTIDLDGGTLRVLGTLAPGNSPGNLTIDGHLAWQSSDAGYQWEINDATGTLGANWDLLTVTGALDLTSLSSTSKYLLDLTTLTSLNAAGSMANYVDGDSYTWSMVSASSVLLASGTAAAGTDITSLFNVSFANWANAAPSEGNYSIRVASSGQGIDLVIVPEPSTVIFAGIGIAMAGWSLWKRCRIARILQN